MKISIFGLGYVGCVGVGCLSKLGHNIIGVDINSEKVALINQGKSPVVEKGLNELIKDGVDKELVSATQNYKDAILNSDISFITVGTPNDINGHLDMSHINAVVEHIAKGIEEKNSFHVIVVRSTVEPGTNLKIGKLVEKISGRVMNENFGVVSNPEFLREGSALDDFFNPPYTLIASESKKALEIIRELYKDVNGEIVETEVGIAEIIKFINNSYHALKVSFANEIGRVCKKLNIDGTKVMNIFSMDTKLNISSSYFKPGFAYGGSCLPKDLKALNLLAHDNYTQIPILSAVEKSNEIHLDLAFNLITSKKKKKIGFLGLSFKQGTDDIRYSPSLELVERLIGKGYEVKIYDNYISLSQLMGKNKEMLYAKIPHIVRILVNGIDELVESSELIVISYTDKVFKEYIFNNQNILKDKYIIDLARIDNKLETWKNYEGICW
ncbi:GDP-mannose 6-dehydrogenase [subsurface metagenome]